MSARRFTTRSAGASLRGRTRFTAESTAGVATWLRRPWEGLPSACQSRGISGGQSTERSPTHPDRVGALGTGCTAKAPPEANCVPRNLFTGPSEHGRRPALHPRPLAEVCGLGSECTPGIARVAKRAVLQHAADDPRLPAEVALRLYVVLHDGIARDIQDLTEALPRLLRCRSESIGLGAHYSVFIARVSRNTFATTCLLWSASGCRSVGIGARANLQAACRGAPGAPPSRDGRAVRRRRGPHHGRVRGGRTGGILDTGFQLRAWRGGERAAI